MDESENVREYFAAVLDINPLESPHEVLARRAAFRGDAQPDSAPGGAAGSGRTASSPPSDPQAPPPDRYAVGAQLEELRRAFWLLTNAEIREHAEAIDVATFPDLDAALRRLLQITPLRAELEVVARDPSSSPEFVEALRAILVAPPRDAIQLRDEFSRQLEAGLPIGPVHRTIKQITRSHPELHEREAAWLQFLLRFKKERKMMTKAAGKWWIWVLLFFSVRAILKLIQL